MKSPYVFRATLAALAIAVACPVPVMAKTHVSMVSPVIAAQTQTITISGSTFGNRAPYTGDSNFISVGVCVGGGQCPGGTWQAGYAPDGNLVGLVVQSWTNTQIVLGGFSGDYGTQYHLTDGDTVNFIVANPKTAKFPRKGCIVTVGSGLGASC